ncbi:hypothetical protein CO045_00560 [Candidatus Peregrinibacteria bacterium CG_4_9_14_0_2_um_filter_41_14]|nr:MAG: hypothetical protein CO045_00560 [Candidatus Peregrinibacteria bacterium CG_4_9_14_0_2_um_filter_41_14]
MDTPSVTVEVSADDQLVKLIHDIDSNNVDINAVVLAWDNFNARRGNCKSENLDSGMVLVFLGEVKSFQGCVKTTYGDADVAACLHELREFAESLKKFRQIVIAEVVGVDDSVETLRRERRVLLMGMSTLIAVPVVLSGLIYAYVAVANTDAGGYVLLDNCVLKKGLSGENTYKVRVPASNLGDMVAEDCTVDRDGDLRCNGVNEVAVHLRNADADAVMSSFGDGARKCVVWVSNLDENTIYLTCLGVGSR